MDSPFTDDRDQQDTLDIGLGASTTEDREGTVVTGSTAFLDDRDRGGGGSSDQLSLFGESDELDGQQDLFGEQATTETEGFFSGTPVGELGDDPGILTTDERALGAAEAERETPPAPALVAFDVPLNPEEDQRGEFATSPRAIGGFDPMAERETDRFDRETAPPGLAPVEPERRDMSIESNIAAADAAGALSPDPNGDADMAPEGVFSDADPRGSAVESDSVREVDLQRLENAESVREEYEQWLDESDKRNRTTVRFNPSTPDAVINQAQLAREDLGAETARSQTVSLTDDERQRIKAADGFDTTTTTANWRSAKGVFAREGLSDQFRDAIGSIADFDDPIEGAEQWVQRHKKRQAEAGVGGVGARDEGETDIKRRQRAGRAAQAEQESFEEHAIEGAREGNQDAIDALVIEAGWDRAEAEALAQRVEDPVDDMTEQRFREIVDAEIKRARSNGRFANPPTQQTTLPGVNRRRTNGRFIDVPLEETEIGRNVETGRFSAMEGNR